MNHFNLFVGLSVLLIVLLAMDVSRLRMREKVANGDGGNKQVAKAIRAHMNAVEHVLPFALLLYVLQSQSVSTQFFAGLAFGFLAIRVLHAYSMLGSKFRLRQLSAGATYLLELVGCVMVLGIALAK